MSDTVFADRSQAGRRLARALLDARLAPPLVVVALPRGGVPVALEVARALGAPLDLVLVRKIGAPAEPELAIAAVADANPPVLVSDPGLVACTGADAAWVEREAGVQQQENARRRTAYLGGRQRPPLAGRIISSDIPSSRCCSVICGVGGRQRPPLAGCTVVADDDGVATGLTMRAALRALRAQGPARLVLAVPVAPPQVLAGLAGEADEIVCPLQPADFRAVGLHYRDFHQVGDAEVVAALDAAARRGEPPGP